MVKNVNLTGTSTASFFLHTRQIESIIGVQWSKENPNPGVHRSSLPCFLLERWTRELGFSCHRASMVNSFSHTTSPNSFTNVSSLFEHGSVRGIWANKKSAKSNTFGTKMFLLFQLRKRIPTLAILFPNKGARDVWNFETLLHKPTSQR